MAKKRGFRLLSALLAAFLLCGCSLFAKDGDKSGQETEAADSGTGTEPAASADPGTLPFDPTASDPTGSDAPDAQILPRTLHRVESPSDVTWPPTTT